MLLVIGIGSPFGDDRVGLLMIDELRRAQRLQPHLGRTLELWSADRPGAGLLSLLEGKDHVAIIDAVITGGSVGELHRWTAPNIPAAVFEKSATNSTHGFGLAQTLALGRTLGTLPQQLHILGIEIDPPELHPGCSPALLQQLPALIERVIDELLFYT